ncbi:MAG: flagellar hook-associated protein FlgL [Fimbriimonadaceae bacterium]|nr:flagellar hook-associated protein FlgL [Fimbriimonadaceae bacterium]QYK57471.1 MAG: flagellar hook-associated protein FlgL [Fimbriimonadaceae bacterium]
MRVSTYWQYGNYLTDMQAAQSRWVEAQRQVATGKRFEYLSEDPAGGQFVANTRSIKSRVEQLDKNLRAADDYLKTTEATLGELSSFLNRARTLAVNGANAATNQEQRDGMAAEVAEIQRRLTALANSVGSNGQYVFAGHRSDQRPFQETPPNLVFTGDTNPVTVEVRPGEKIRVNMVAADTYFTGIYDDLERLKSNLQSGDLSAVSQDIDVIKAGIDRTNQLRGEAGARMRDVAAQREHNERRIDDLATAIADVQEIDVAQAIVRLHAAEAAYTGAMSVASRGFSLSLLDFMR